ncbi:MAG TPA: AMIN domain-containing protein, partial [Gemmatimonadales bacterium]|nr:AMIN domain-containing protein [Gemmatimonadales bacterium]
MIGLSRVLLAAAMAFAPASTASPAGPTGGEVTSVALRPAAPGRAEIVIGIRGSVAVRDFMLEHPDRLVLDVTGARLNSTGEVYDGVNRGGVRNIRYAQFRPDVVRIVLELDHAKPYTIDHTDDAI